MTFSGYIIDLFKDWMPFLGTLAGVLVLFLLIKTLFTGRLDSTFSEYRIIKHLIFLGLFGFSVIFLTLAMPIDQALRGQLLALLGLLASAVVALSSATFVGNAMAGLMLRNVKNFEVGDFLKVGEHFGRISEFSFLHTEIQTQDRDLTTLPNLYLVTHPVTVVHSSGTIISATVSLGYDIPHSKVEKALKMAAEKTSLSESFVQVTDLGDSSITYRIAGFLKDVKKLISTKSSLRKNMLDFLHQEEIEIVSPNFMNQRLLLENKRFIPKKFRKEVMSFEKDPENIMFAKADQAKSVEEIKKNIKVLERKLSEMKDPKKEGEKDTYEALEKRIQDLKEVYKDKTKGI